MKAGAEMNATWGRRTNTIDNRRRACSLVIDVLDPSLALYDTLVNEDNSESDFSIVATDSTGTYTLNMRVRLDEVSTDLVPDTRQQVTRIYCYDGQAELDNVDAIIQTSSTFHNLYRSILASTAISQDIEYYSAHYAENVAGSGALLDLMRLYRLDLIFAEEGRKIDSMGGQLDSLLEGLGMWSINGLDGRWHVKNEFGLGSTHNDRSAQYFTAASTSITTLNTLAASLQTLVPSNIERSTTRRPIRAVQAVEVDRGNGRTFFTVDVMKHGDFENGWTDANTHEVWTTVEGSYSRDTQADTGTYSLKLPSGSNRADQKLLRFAGGLQDIDIEVALRYSFESDSASTTKTGTSFLSLRYANDLTLDTKIGDAGSTWQDIVGSIALNTGIVANGASLIWTTLITTIYGPLPDFDGNLKVSVNNALANFAARFDTLEVRVKRGEDGLARFRSVTGRYDLSGNLIGSGDVVRQRVPWYNGIIGTDETEDGTRDEVIPMMQVLTTAGGSWVQASQFRSFAGGFTANQYDDLFELTGEVRIAQQERTLEQIEGSVMEIVPHERALQYGAKTYLQAFTEIDFRTEVTKFVALERAGIIPSNPPLTAIYFAEEARVRKVAVSDTLPFADSTIISSITSGRENMQLKVDEPARFIFLLQFTTADSREKHLVRYNLDGSAEDDKISWLTSGVWTATAFTVARSAQRVYVIESRTDTNGFQIVSYDYEGNVVETVYSQPDTFTFGQGLGISPSEDYLFWVEDNNDFSPYYRLYRLDLINGGAPVSMGVPTNAVFSSGGTSPDSILIDSLDANGIFTNIGLDITKWPYPDGASESTVTTNPGTPAMTLDRVNQKIYYNGIGVTTGKQEIRRIGYDSSSDEEVFNGSADIVSIDSGYN